MPRSRPSRRSFFLACSLLLVGGMVLVCFLWVRTEQRQYALNRQLIEALINGDTKQALELVNAGADPNTPCLSSPTPSLRLLFAHLLRHSPPAKASPTAFMLVCCVEWNPENDYSIPNPLICQRDNTPLLEAMWAHGANLEARTLEHCTALHFAARVSCGFKIMQWLVEHGADVDGSEEEGDTLLMTADPDQARLLLAHHANPNAQTVQGDTPLHIALNSSASLSARNLKDLVSVLLTYGANANLPNKKGETPLLLAQKIKRPDLVALLQKGRK